MPFGRSSALIATAYLALSARALPRPAPTYQVVDVGGPSSEAPPQTIVSTVIESSTPSTVTEPAITVTATPNPPAAETQSITTTQSWTVAIGNTEQTAYSHTAGSPPLPTLDAPNGAPPAAPVPATETQTIYNTVPVPYAAAPTPSTTSSSLKGAYTPVAQWNHTVTAIPGPTSAGTGLMYAAVPTGSPLAKRWHRFAATGTGAHLAGRAAPTGTGAYLAGRAAPTGTGAYLYGRAAATGTGAWLAGRAAPTGYGPQGWNATSYYYGSNDRLA